MREFQGERAFRRYLYSFPLFIVLLLLTLFLGASVYSLYEKNRYAQVNLSEVQARVVDLERRKEFLSATVARLSTVEGQEVEIRSRFPVALAGEQVLSIVDATSAPASSTVEERSKAPWWQFWK